MSAMEVLLYWGGGSVALVAIIVAAERVGKVLRAIWRTINRFNEVADDLLGDKAKGVLPMRERMLAMEDWKRQHEEQGHAPHVNGPSPVPFQRKRR